MGAVLDPVAVPAVAEVLAGAEPAPVGALPEIPDGPTVAPALGAPVVLVVPVPTTLLDKPGPETLAAPLLVAGALLPVLADALVPEALPVLALPAADRPPLPAEIDAPTLELPTLAAADAPPPTALPTLAPPERLPPFPLKPPPSPAPLAKPLLAMNAEYATTEPISRVLVRLGSPERNKIIAAPQCIVRP